MSSPPHDDWHEVHDSRRLYTVAEFAALPVDRSRRYELQEGVVIASPTPVPRHMLLVGDLHMQIRPQLPAGLLVLPDIDVDLQSTPPVVRAPDVTIALACALDGPGLTVAAEILIAVEILSPGSRRTDTVIKPVEYAEAGIPQYWLVDPEPPVTINVFMLVDGHYEESQRAEHVLVVEEPCPLRIDLDALTV
ncbi:Uma2 family endonuclease [Actinokineospora sp.]|uniref:Uma2 family endonuclease n=1 Tax=Actinokineospora sp. TaxID=1872133 RepID=UPI0040377867